MNRILLWQFFVHLQSSHGETKGMRLALQRAASPSRCAYGMLGVTRPVQRVYQRPRSPRTQRSLNVRR